MTGEQITVVVLLVLNFIVALVYLLYGLLIKGKQKNTDEKFDRKKYVISFIVMLICPVGAAIFLLFSVVLYKIFFRKEVDLADVVFSKEKVESMSRGDDERERNFVPLEEALAISDKQSLRTLMLNILRGDVSESLRSISYALNSSDTEAAHYAASVLRDELNDFRSNVQKMYDEMKENPEQMLENALALLKYMNAYLSQRVFTEMEQDTYVHMMAEVAATIVTINEDELLPEHYEWLTTRFLEIKDYEGCEYWAKLCWLQYPNELISYTSQLKMYFEMGERQRFFSVMQELKSSSVVIDKETLELIRTFS